MITLGQIIKGNPDNLEGRVMIYVENLDSTDEPSSKYPSIYASTHDPWDLADYDSFGELTEKFLEQAETRKKYYDFLKICYKETVRGAINFPFITTAIPDLNEIPKIKGDVIYGGAYSNNNISDIVSNILNEYMEEYVSQIDAERVYKDPKEFSTLDLKYYDGKDLKSLLYNMTEQLLHSVYTGDLKLEEAIVKHMRKFFRESVLAHPMHNLIGMAKSNMEGLYKLEYMMNLIELIGDVKDEEFESAIIHQVNCKEVIKTVELKEMQQILKEKFKAARRANSKKRKEF